jgi:hypothetical protein
MDKMAERKTDRKMNSTFLFEMESENYSDLMHEIVKKIRSSLLNTWVRRDQIL